MFLFFYLFGNLKWIYSRPFSFFGQLQWNILVYPAVASWVTCCVAWTYSLFFYILMNVKRNIGWWCSEFEIIIIISFECSAWQMAASSLLMGINSYLENSSKWLVLNLLCHDGRRRRTLHFPWKIGTSSINNGKVK